MWRVTSLHTGAGSKFSLEKLLKDIAEWRALCRERFLQGYLQADHPGGFR